MIISPSRVAVAAATVLLTAAVPLAHAAPAAAASASVWTQQGYGPGNTGYNPDESELNASTVKSLQDEWSWLLSSDDPECADGQFTPVVAGGRTFTADPGGIYAHEATDGLHEWTFTYAEPEVDLATNLAVAGNVLIATVAKCSYGSGTTVYGLDVSTGDVLWWNQLGVNSYGLVVDKGIAAVGGWDDYSEEDPDLVAGFRISDGSLRWVRSGVRLGAGASANGTLLLSRSETPGSLAVKITTGAQVWQSAKSWSVLAANPAGDRFYVGDPAGSLVAVKSATGAAVWTVKKAAGALSTDGRRLYVARGKVLTAYDPAKGKKLWSKTQAAYANRPVRAGGLLYSVIDDRPMAILNPANGATVASGAAYRYTVGQPAVAGGMLYVYDGASLLAYGL
jgi:outer membrane protein assembly factor BamB